MQHTISARNTNKKASSARRGARLVRIERRDLGLGAAGLGVVRALVLAVGSLGERAAATPGRAGAVVEGGGGGVAVAAGGWRYDGFGGENFSLKALR